MAYYEKTITKPLMYGSKIIAEISGTFSTELVPDKEARTLLEAMLTAAKAEEEYNKYNEGVEIIIKEKCSDEFLAYMKSIMMPIGWAFSNAWENWKKISSKPVKNFVTRKHAEEIFLCSMPGSVAEEDARQYLLIFYKQKN